MVFVAYMGMILFMMALYAGVVHFENIRYKKLQHLNTAMSQNDIASLSETHKQIVEEYTRNNYKPITYGEFNDLVIHQEQVESLKQ